MSAICRRYVAKKRAPFVTGWGSFSMMTAACNYVVLLNSCRARAAFVVNCREILGSRSACVRAAFWPCPRTTKRVIPSGQVLSLAQQLTRAPDGPQERRKIIFRPMTRKNAKMPETAFTGHFRHGAKTPRSCAGAGRCVVAIRRRGRGWPQRPRWAAGAARATAGRRA